MLKHSDDIVLDEILALCNYIWEAGKFFLSLSSINRVQGDGNNGDKYIGELSNDPSGCRIGRSTVDSIVVLDQDIRKAIVNKEAVVGVFMDTEKVYDSKWRECVLIKLHDAGIKGRISHCIKDFFNYRSVQVRVGGAVPKLSTFKMARPNVM